MTASISSITSASVAKPAKIQAPAIDSLAERVMTTSIQYFRWQIAEKFAALISSSRNVDATYKGWSLLHYCSFLCTHSCDDPELLDLMQSLVHNGANPNLRDPQGRTPIYFHSGEGDDGKTLECLLDAGAEINPANDVVAPLHVTASFLWLRTRFLVAKGANPYVLDKFGRMPIHCLVAAPDFMMENAENLVENAPLCTEHADNLQNYPLYYAMVYGPREFADFLRANTSGITIRKVLEKIKIESQLSHFPPEHFFDDPIYQHDDEFSPRIAGGGRRKATKPSKDEFQKAASDATEKSQKEIFSFGGKKFHLHPDSHGGKHLTFSKNEKMKLAEKEEIVKKTIGRSALFFPHISRQYRDVLSFAIRQWATKGADTNYSYVKLSESIGADNGVETSWVELYYGGEVGSHIRPKHLESNQRPNSLSQPISSNHAQSIERSLHRNNRETLKYRLECDPVISIVYSYLLSSERFYLFGISPTLPKSSSKNDE